MKMVSRICLLLCMLWAPGWTKHVSGTISDDVTFFHRSLSDFPSKQVTVEYSIRYNLTKMSLNCSRNECAKVFLGFHTTDQDKQTSKQCFSSYFGQVRNENLVTPLRTTLQYNKYRFTLLSYADDEVTAKAKIKIYDFKERNFSFSLGFFCTELLEKNNISLNGIMYDFYVYNQTKVPYCGRRFPYIYDLTYTCLQFYPHMSEQNLLGVINRDVSFVNNFQGRSIFESVKRTFLLSNSKMFYQHFEELACRLLLPECKSKGTVVVHPCQEMCHDFVDAFWEILKDQIPKLMKVFPSLAEAFRQGNQYENILNCSYLPSLSDPYPCHYQAVECDSPPIVENAAVNQSIQFSVFSTVEYFCVNDQYQMEGNNTVTCLYSGHWSKPPVCKKVVIGFNSPAVITISILAVPFVIFVALLVCSCRKSCRVENVRVPHLNPRETEFDAFLCYNFDMDNNYVLTEFLPEIDESTANPDVATTEHHLLLPKEVHDEEQTRKKANTPNTKQHTHGEEGNQSTEDAASREGFKILIERRDFVPALLIDVNIENAIKKSNCAILLVSQGFVNSPWCRQEFQMCKLENMKDTSFKIFVIMMQPESELENVTISMKRFFETTTFLKKDDPGLFTKLRRNLTELRQIHGSPV